MGRIGLVIFALDDEDKKTWNIEVGNALDELIPCLEWHYRYLSENDRQDTGLLLQFRNWIESVVRCIPPKLVPDDMVPYRLFNSPNEVPVDRKLFLKIQKVECDLPQPRPVCAKSVKSSTPSSSTPQGNHRSSTVHSANLVLSSKSVSSPKQPARDGKDEVERPVTSRGKTKLAAKVEPKNEASSAKRSQPAPSSKPPPPQPKPTKRKLAVVATPNKRARIQPSTSDDENNVSHPSDLEDAKDELHGGDPDLNYVASTKSKGKSKAPEVLELDNDEEVDGSDAAAGEEVVNDEGEDEVEPDDPTGDASDAPVLKPVNIHQQKVSEALAQLIEPALVDDPTNRYVLPPRLQIDELDLIHLENLKQNTDSPCHWCMEAPIARIVACVQHNNQDKCLHRHLSNIKSSHAQMQASAASLELAATRYHNDCDILYAIIAKFTAIHGSAWITRMSFETEESFEKLADWLLSAVPEGSSIDSPAPPPSDTGVDAQFVIKNYPLASSEARTSLLNYLFMSNRMMTGAQVTELFNKAGRTKLMLAQNFANHLTDACISPCVIEYSNSVSDLIKKVPTLDKVTKIVTHAKEAISRLHQFKGRKSDFKFPKSMSVITRFLNEIDSVAFAGDTSTGNIGGGFPQLRDQPPLADVDMEPPAETAQGRGVVEPNVPTGPRKERTKAQNISNTDDMNVSDSEQARRPVTVFVNNTTAPATGKATSAKKRKTNKVDELSREARDNNAADSADKLSFRRSTDLYRCGKLIVLPYSSLPKMNRDTSAYQTAIHCIDASQVKEIEAAHAKAERRTKERSKKSLSAPCFSCGNEDHAECDCARFIATESEISVKQACKRLERLLAQDPGADVLAAKLQFDVVQYDASILKRTRLNEILIKKMADVP
ncbi:hypothetical protein C8J56DRAFT_1057824 [Mycena floridula]|nr:hypothetical protein C8J56DRAFT_1057824 [Mycena floridula]